MVVPELLARWEIYLVYHMLGQYAGAWNIWENSVIPAIQFPAFWLVLGLVALGLTRSGEWKPSKKQKTILLAALLLRSALGFVFARITAMGAPMEVIDMTVNMTRQWTLLCWLWPLLILRVFRALGEGRIGTGGAAISLLGMQLGEGLLLPLLTAGKIGFPMFGAAGPSLASGISPLFGLLILHIATRLHKKKLTGVN